MLKYCPCWKFKLWYSTMKVYLTFNVSFSVPLDDINI